MNSLTDGNADDYLHKGYDGDVYGNGPDLVYEQPMTAELVVTESKFLSSKGNFGLSNLGKTDNGYQMSRGWIEYVYQKEVGVDSTLANKMITADRSGTLRKEITSIQNRPHDGYTITKSVAELGIEKVTLYKIGEQR